MPKAMQSAQTAPVDVARPIERMSFALARSLKVRWSEP
jgi:hypothetical protein